MNKTEKACCHNCDHSLRFPMHCSECNSLQRFNSKPSLFALFGLDPHYNLDVGQLEHNLDELMSELHPDLYVSGSEEEQKLSLDYTAQLNEGFELLVDSFRRGKYLLQTLDNHVQFKQISKLSQGFLISMFEYGEEIDQLENDQGDIQAVRSDIKELLTKGKTAVKESFEKLLMDTSNEDLILEVGQHLGKLKFYLNLQERLNKI